MLFERGIIMHYSSETTAKTKMVNKTNKNENGLQKLAIYYQSLFDIEENLNYYGKEEYQNAKRKFVKHLMDNRRM